MPSEGNTTTFQFRFPEQRHETPGVVPAQTDSPERESHTIEPPRHESPMPSSPEAGGFEPFLPHTETHQSDGDDSDGSGMVDDVVSAFLNNQIPTPLAKRSVLYQDAPGTSPEPPTPVEQASPQQIDLPPPLPQQTSKFGTAYRSFPSSVVKRLATAAAQSAGVTNGKLGKDTLLAISQASDWFFEQVAEDLASYADHAGRKTIEESDMLALMRR